MDIPRSRDEVRENLNTITEQIQNGIEQGRYTAQELQQALMDRTRRAAESTDELVHEYPWSAIGIGVAVGLLVGLLMPRR